MQKSWKMNWDTVTLVFIGLLVGMHIVLTRIVSIDLGFCRISVSSVCTILAGLWFGPIGGGLCGLLADLLGCMIKGYAVNPFITVAAILWGVIPAIVARGVNGTKTKKIIFLCVSIVITGILSSLVFNTAGLVLMLGYNFYAIMPGRLIQWAAMTPIYCVLTGMLYFSPLTRMIVNAGNHKES